MLDSSMWLSNPRRVSPMRLSQDDIIDASGGNRLLPAVIRTAASVPLPFPSLPFLPPALSYVLQLLQSILPLLYSLHFQIRTLLYRILSPTPSWRNKYSTPRPVAPAVAPRCLRSGSSAKNCHIQDSSDLDRLWSNTQTEYTSPSRSRDTPPPCLVVTRVVFWQQETSASPTRLAYHSPATTE